VPWAANLATLAVVVAATGWSATQRPAESPATAAVLAAATPAATLPRLAPVPAAAKHAPGTPALHTAWPAGANGLPREALQPVVYNATLAR
jgi:hypothetical protein